MRNDIEFELIYGLTGPRTLLHFHSNRIVPKLDSSHSSTSSFSPLSHFDETGSYHSSISKILKSLSYLTWFSVLICIFFCHNHNIERKLQKSYLKFFSASCNVALQMTSALQRALLCWERCHLSKMFFQFNQWPAKFHSFLSFLCDKKSLLYEVCHRVWFHSCV